MKLLFFVQRSYSAELTLRLAEHYRQRYPAARFAALCYTLYPDAAHLRELELFDEVHSEAQMHQKASGEMPDLALLRRLERDYGSPTLWQFVTQNRVLTMRYFGDLFSYGSPYTRAEILSHIATRFLETEAFLDQFKPDAVIFPEVDVGPGSAFILERVARARDIPVIVPKSVRLGSYHTFTDTVLSRIPQIEENFRHFRTGGVFDRERARQVLTDFRSGQLPLSYITYEFDQGKRSLLDKLRRALKLRLRREYVRSDPILPTNLEYDLHKFVVVWRRLKLRLAGQFTQPEPHERYVFFPLHTEPELSLSLYAPFYTDQIAIIRNVAQSLPVDTCLYVKDHIVAQGRRHPEFFKELSGIPNVRLLEPNLSSLKLIRGADGVVSVTGTAALEAALLGKPALTFGDAFFNVLDGPIRHTHDFEAVPGLLEDFRSYQHDEEELLAFVGALLENSVAVDPLVLGKALSLGPPDLANRSAAFSTYAGALFNEIEARLSKPLPSPRLSVAD